MKNLPFHFLRKRISKTSTQVELKIMRLGTSKNRVHLHFKEGDNLSQNSEPCHCGVVRLICCLLLGVSIVMSSSSTKSTWSGTEPCNYTNDLSLKYPKTLTLLDIRGTVVITD